MPTVKLRRSTLLAYGSLGIPLSVLGLPSYIFLPTFLAQDVGLGLATVGTLFILARLWDVITDPLIGRVSDGLMGWHRRKTVIAVGLPMLALATWLLFRPPFELTVWSAGLLLFVFYLGWTTVAVPTYAWGAELSSDYDQKSRVTAFREGLFLFGTLLALILPIVIPNTAGVSAAAHSLMVLAYAAIVLLALASALAFWQVPDVKQTLSPIRLTWGEQWQILKQNQGFWPLIRAYFFNGFANGLPGILFLLFAQHYLKIPDDDAKLLLLLYFVAGIISIPFWLWLSKRTDKHRAWQWGMGAACVFFLCVPLVPIGGYVPFMLITLLTGLCLGADLVLPSSIQADVIHADSTVTKQQRAGLFFAWWGIITKLSLAMGSAAFIVLDGFGFSTDGNNDTTALTSLVVLYSIVPVACKALAIWQMYHFPLTRGKVASFQLP